MKPTTLLILALGIVLLGGLFFIVKPQQAKDTQPTTQEATPTPEIKTKTFTLVVKGRKLVSGPETITVTQDDEVVIKITADEPEEFHIHGYDKFVDLKKDEEGELAFTANLTGRFHFELEKSKT